MWVKCCFFFLICMCVKSALYVGELFCMWVLWMICCTQQIPLASNSGKKSIIIKWKRSPAIRFLCIAKLPRADETRLKITSPIGNDVLSMDGTGRRYKESSAEGKHHVKWMNFPLVTSVVRTRPYIRSHVSGKEALNPLLPFIGKAA